MALGIGRDESVRVEADRLYEALTAAGLDVLYDDRDESPGVKFNDADLIGVPLRATVSTRNVKEGVVEVQARGAEASKVAGAEAVAHLTSMRASLLAELTPRE
ncbi:MAG: His/Gly/Thr/Pro-type tRNA ligase C-terminal domain-containing protein [Dehalococcoidia bacterium]